MSINFLKIHILPNIKIKIYSQIKEKTHPFQEIFICLIIIREIITIKTKIITDILDPRMLDSMKIKDLLIIVFVKNKGQISIGKITEVNLLNLLRIQILLIAGTKFVSISKEKQQRKRNLLWPLNNQENLKIVL